MYGILSIILLILTVAFSMQCRIKNRGYLVILSNILVSSLLGLQIKIAIKDSYVGISFTIILIMIFLIINLGENNVNKARVINFKFIALLSIVFLGVVSIQIYSMKIIDWIMWGRCIYQFYIVFTLILLINKLYKVNFQVPLFKIVRIVAIINFLLGVAQVVTGKNLLVPELSVMYTEGVVDTIRVHGFIASNNGAGNFSAILMPILIFDVLQNKKMISYTSLLLNIIFMLLTKTRVAYLAFGIEIVIIFIFYNNTYKNFIKKIFLFVIGCMGIIFIMNRYFLVIYNKLFLERGNTGSYRILQFDFATKMIPGNIISGVGIGQYETYSSLKYYWANGALHSQYLNTMIESGIFGFGVFLIINIYLLYLAMKKLRRHSNIAVALFLGNLVAINVNPNQLYHANNFIYFFVFLCLIYFDNSYVRKKRNLKIRW